MKRTATPIIAYFSAEYAIADDLPIYAGGLGILAGDLVLEAGLENRELYAVGMVYHQAFAQDDLDQRPLIERLRANGFELVHGIDGARLLARVQINGRDVAIQAWVKRMGRTRLILLDTNLTENDTHARRLCDRLYPGDTILAFEQQMCLGIGGVALLERLGITPDIYHMNEGHTALAGLAVVMNHKSEADDMTLAEAIAAAQPKLIATKHTILPGAGLILKWDDLRPFLGAYLAAHNTALDELIPYAQKTNGDYSDTKLMLALASRASGVSKMHVLAERKAHSESDLIAITNGVSRWRWTTTAWGGQPLNLDDEKLWAIHTECRRQLIDYVQTMAGVTLDPNRLTVVWARRMTAYKRPGLLISDLAKLHALINDQRTPVQFIVAGQANPADDEGLAIMQRLVAVAQREDITPGFAYLPSYTVADAKYLVRGADVWLNTPIQGFEACGTSGMKASMNGAVQFSTSDGWIHEVNIHDIGWLLPNRAEQAIYKILDEEIAPLFYERTDGVPTPWIYKMRANMKLALERFTSERMLSDYYEKLYDTAYALTR